MRRKAIKTTLAECLSAALNVLIELKPEGISGPYISICANSGRLDELTDYFNKWLNKKHAETAPIGDEWKKVDKCPECGKGVVFEGLTPSHFEAQFRCSGGHEFKKSIPRR